MPSEQHNRRRRDEQYAPAGLANLQRPGSARGADPEPSRFDLPVPNGLRGAELAAHVDRVLVELTHEPVGAEYVAANVWGPTRTQYLPDGTGPTPFTKRHYDERLGWVVGSISRQGLRAELLDLLSREQSRLSQRSDAQSATTPDRFRVRAIETLR